MAPKLSSIEPSQYLDGWPDLPRSKSELQLEKYFFVSNFFVPFLSFKAFSFYFHLFEFIRVVEYCIFCSKLSIDFLWNNEIINLEQNMLHLTIVMNSYGQNKCEKAWNDEKSLKEKEKKFTIFQRSPIQVLTGLDAAATLPQSDLKKLI